MKRFSLILILLFMVSGARAQATFATAEAISAGVTKSDTVNGTQLQHYYKAAIPAMGLLRLTTTTTNIGAAFGIVQYRLCWKNQNTITTRNVNRNASTGAADTFTIACIQADSIYIVVDNIWAGQPMVFSLSFDIQGAAPNNESASNETQATAELLPPDSLKSGHISFGTPSGTDVDDYYRIVFPREGTFRLYAKATILYPNGSAPAPRLYFYNKYGTAINFFRATGTAVGYADIGGIYGPTFTQATDTMSIYARSADTFYLRVYNYHSGLGVAFSAAYSLKWELTDTSRNNEGSPNEALLQASLLPEDSLIQGHISYANSNGVDLDDYYKIVLQKDATITLFVSSKNTWNRQANPSPVFYVLDKMGNALTVQNNAGVQSGTLRVASSAAAPFLSTLQDTMHVFGRAQDTFYVRVYNYHSGMGWNWAAQYSLRYQLTDTAVTNEVEPNDAFSTAQPIREGDTIRGHVNYIKGGYATDIDDYFRIVKPKNGAIRIFIKSRNNWGYANTSWAPGVWAYNSSGNSLLVKNVAGAMSGGGLRVRNNYYVPYSVTLVDTMFIECVPNDTLYLRLQNYFNYVYGGWSANYEFSYEYLPPAKSKLSYARVGNDFGFVNEALNAKSYLWLMGNGQQYSSFYCPVTHYGPGNYDVKLIAIDNTCNYRDTALVNFTVAGIEYYTPKHAGKGGDAILELFGGALDTNTVIKLVQGGTTLLPRAKYINRRLNHLTADFDFHSVNAGLYDLILQVPGQPTITYSNGFRIDAFEYPYAWATVKAPWRIRTNVDNAFSLVVGNRGNVTASGVVVALAWPKSVQVTWKAKFHQPDYSKDDTLITDTTTYIFPNEAYRYIYDSTNTTVPIDSFNGQPFDGYIRYLQVAHLPANGLIEIPFIARASSQADLRFHCFSHQPNFLGSCPTGNYDDYADGVASELLDGADMFADQTKIPLFQAFTKSAKIGQKHMQSASSYLGKEFWAWYDGYETDHEANLADWIRETGANNEYAKEVAAKEIAGLLFKQGIAKAVSNNEQILAINRMLAKNPNMSAKNFEATIKILNRLGKNTPNINYDRLKLLAEMFDDAKNLYDLNEKLKKLEELVKDCPELKEQEQALRDMLNQELNHRDPNDLLIYSRVSFDPNSITGPTGVDSPRYLSNFQTQPFVIHFENIDSAGAAAQKVIVQDTIDKTHFDIASLSFGDVTIGTQQYRVPINRNNFVVEHPLDSFPALKLRIVAQTDTATGIISWHFSTIDTATLGAPVFDGFLPPNRKRPEGEASVTYYIKPLSSLADGSLMSSKASIWFDDNPAIQTDKWVNKLDIAPPNSSIVSGTVVTDTIIKLNFAGTDASSGIRSYQIFCSTNSGPWHRIGQSTSDSVIIHGQYDSSYRFYVTALDNVGNQEQKTALAEYSVAMPMGVESQALAATGASLTITPNPASDQANLRVHLTRSATISLHVLNPIGQPIADLYSGTTQGIMNFRFDLSSLPSGMYLVVLRLGGKQTQTAKLSVIH
ncbi:MAG: T9SS type A sorting domain-containing protein [Bacteroidetes bacterium]|nr:T9SS type A sorting domain-containing protein [Bacteroidota bacterium]